MKIGEGIDGFNVAEVIESRNPNYAVGDLICAGGGWREHIVSDGRGYIQKITDRRVELGCWIGVLGVPGLTAWFGLNRVGQAKPGETLLVTSAAGPVGATGRTSGQGPGHARGWRGRRPGQMRLAAGRGRLRHRHRLQGLPMT